jgi:hypothetical protein
VIGAARAAAAGPPPRCQRGIPVVQRGARVRSDDGQGIAALASGNLDGIGRSGTGVLMVDGKAVATRTMERTIPLTVQ